MPGHDLRRFPIGRPSHCVPTLSWERSVHQATLTFMSSDWDPPQTVTVIAVDDGAEGFDATISVDNNCSRNECDALADGTVTATTVDDDPPQDF